MKFNFLCRQEAGNSSRSVHVFLSIKYTVFLGTAQAVRFPRFSRGVPEASENRSFEKSGSVRRWRPWQDADSRTPGDLFLTKISYGEVVVGRMRICFPPGILLCIFSLSEGKLRNVFFSFEQLGVFFS